jgi:thiamine transport system substrate-binding protein
MKRRQVLASLAGVGGLAGCLTRDDAGGTTDAPTETSTDTTEGGTDAATGTTTVGTATPQSLEGTLTVGTYGSFVDAPSTSPGPWIKEEFEKQHPDVTLEWAVPENGIDHYIRRRRSGATIDADCWVGLKVPELVRVDQQLSKPLFEGVATDRVENWQHVKDGFSLDPQNRVMPLFTGYMSFVYDGTAVENPGTLDALTTAQYRGKVTVQNPITDNTGLYFLLWTIKEQGEDGYLDYWQRLLDNDATVLDSWGSVYNAFTSGEAPVITSYSNDRVYAKRAGADLAKHRISFPGDHGYTNLSGFGKFATSDQDALVRAFTDFMLGADAQGVLAEKNVSFPVTDHASVPDVFEQYAKVPEDPLLYTYDELSGNLETWRDEWSRTVASK